MDPEITRNVSDRAATLERQAAEDLLSLGQHPGSPGQHPGIEPPRNPVRLKPLRDDPVLGEVGERAFEEAAHGGARWSGWTSAYVSRE